jgi:hypothetical protein
MMASGIKRMDITPDASDGLRQSNLTLALIAAKRQPTKMRRNPDSQC